MIENAIFTILSGNGAVAALVASRIYPVIAPPDAATPYVTYQKISGPRFHSLGGASGLANPRIQVDSYAETYAGAKGIADKIRLALVGYRGTANSTRIGEILLDNEIDGYEATVEPKLYRVTLDFLILHSEN